jgi:MinD-like ATPase involved in chromosome partitioning or flagellar assembly
LLLALWSPKGGSGTSVLSAAIALVLARRGPVRLADLGGDQPAVFGLSPIPTAGLYGWLLQGAGAPTEALDRLTVPISPGLDLLPFGSVPKNAPDIPPESGAALATALRDGPDTVIDVGTQDGFTEAAVEVSDVSIVVVRNCYLALRRAVHQPLVARAAGAILVEEAGRSFGHGAVGEVLGCPVLARVPVRSAVARVVDAGLLPSRLPPALAAPARQVLDALGLGRTGRAA